MTDLRMPFFYPYVYFILQKSKYVLKAFAETNMVLLEPVPLN